MAAGRPQSFLVARSAPWRREWSLGQQMSGGWARSRRRCEAAVGAGDDAFASEEPGYSEGCAGRRTRVLNVIGGGAEDAGNENFAVREVLRFPDFEFVLVAGVGLQSAWPWFGFEEFTEDFASGMSWV